MTTSTAARVLAGAALIGSLACAGAASAQAAAAAPPPLGGPVINGVCILDKSRMVSQSAVGKAVTARLNQLAQQVNAELTPTGNALQTERQQLASQKVAESDPRVAAWSQKAANLQRTAQIRDREIQLTEQKALDRIGVEADPVVRTVYAQKNCGLMLSRAAVIGGNQQMDITDAVIAGLNAKITTFNFNREVLPTQQAAAPAPAPVKK